MRHGVALDLWQKDDAATVKAEAGPVVACPQCGKPLRERNGAKGPFVGCSGYPACRFTTNGTLDQFTGEADVDPDDFPGFGPEPGPATDGLGAQIDRLVAQLPGTKVRDAFLAVPNVGPPCIALIGGQWIPRPEKIAALTEADKRAIIAKLEG